MTAAQLLERGDEIAAWFNAELARVEANWNVTEWQAAFAERDRLEAEMLDEFRNGLD